MISTLIGKAIARSEEGFSSRPYEDAGGYSIGYGYRIGKRLEDLFLPREACEALLEYKYLEAFLTAQSLAEHAWAGLSEVRKLVLTLMLYQLGAGVASSFLRFWERIHQKDYPGAAREMIASKWYIQTPDRVEKLVYMLEHDELHPEYTKLTVGI